MRKFIFILMMLVSVNVYGQRHTYYNPNYDLNHDFYDDYKIEEKVRTIVATDKLIDSVRIDINHKYDSDELWEDNPTYDLDKEQLLIDELVNLWYNTKNKYCRYALNKIRKKYSHEISNILEELEPIREHLWKKYRDFNINEKCGTWGYMLPLFMEYTNSPHGLMLLKEKFCTPKMHKVMSILEEKEYKMYESFCDCVYNIDTTMYDYVDYKIKDIEEQEKNDKEIEKYNNYNKILNKYSKH